MHGRRRNIREEWADMVGRMERDGEARAQGIVLDRNGAPVGDRRKCSLCAGIGLDPWTSTGACFDCKGAGWR